MKKAITLLLSVIVIISCSIVAVSAAATKMNDSLQQVMDQTADDAKIKVHIWLYCPIDESEVFRQAVKECGYIGGLPLNMTIEEVNAYRAVYNRIVSEQEAAVSRGFVEKLDIAEEDIEYLGKHPYVIALLTKEQIREADTYPEVESISYAESAVIEEPFEDEDIEAPLPCKLYLSRFQQKYEGEYEKTAYYRELYYHYDSDGAVDWALVRCGLNICAPALYNTIIGNRVIQHGEYAAPFASGYAVYDVKEDRFVGADSIDAKAYDGLHEAFDAYVTEGRLLGDLDGDNEISIIDVTILQRCEVKMRDYPADDEIRFFGNSRQKYFSDFNRDGVRNILDATCIQRFLIGLPYPISTE